MNPYPELKRRIQSAGLLRPQPAHYIPHAAHTAIILAVSIAVLVITDSVWVQLANAALLAYVTVQLCFLGHDAGHNQIFRSTRNNHRAGLLISIFVGINRTWWITKHNRHHGNPNDEDHDPDIDIPFLALSPEQARNPRPLRRLTIRYQAYIFYPLTCLEGVVLKVSGIPTLLSGNARNNAAECAAGIIHLAAYFSVIFVCLPPWPAVVFIVVHHALTGLYISATFAPNHKGMPTTQPDNRPDFLTHQVTTSRNVRPSPLNDLLYGGLNYQIEHHLFPSMPRRNLAKARPIVHEFCRELGIDYHETGILQSQREILSYLNNIRSYGAPPNKATATTA